MASTTSFDHELAAARMLMLIQFMEGKEGSRSAAASAMGLSQSYVSKIASGERTTVGANAVNTAGARCGISTRFFTDKVLDPGGLEAYRRALRLAHEPNTMRMDWLFGDAAVFIESVVRNPTEANVRAFCEGLTGSPMMRVAALGASGDVEAGKALAEALLPVVRRASGGELVNELNERGAELIERWV